MLRFKNEKGIMLVTTMILLVVLTLMAVGALTISGWESPLSNPIMCRTASLQCTELAKTIVVNGYLPGQTTIPILNETNVGGVIYRLYSGHIPNTVGPMYNKATGVAGSGGSGWVFCTNDTGCNPSGGTPYGSSVVCEVENCQPIEIEYIILRKF